MTRWRALDDKAAVTAPGVLAPASVIGFLLVYALTVRTTPGRQFGDASLRGAIVINSAVVDAVDAVLGVVSVATLLGGLAAIALIALVRLRRVPGLAAVGLLVAANTSTWLLKTHLLTRPDLGLREIAPATHNSLPSGHSTAVFSVVVALLVVVPARARRPVAITGGAAAVVMALATMSAGWHRVRRGGSLPRIRAGAHPPSANQHGRRGVGLRRRRRPDRRGGGSGTDGRALGARAHRSLDHPSLRSATCRRCSSPGWLLSPSGARNDDPDGLGCTARRRSIGSERCRHSRLQREPAGPKGAPTGHAVPVVVRLAGAREPT